MESLLLEIVDKLRACDQISTPELAGIIRKHNRSIHEVEKHHSKKKLLRFCLKLKQNDSARWMTLVGNEETEMRLFRTLQIKPRRTASGVATITVITKPWRCGSNCLYCPNDVRMPKSYLTDEPACQRAERNFFDPYLQVTSRLRALTHMGHNTDKVELIVLGGTWSDYPQEYQIWYISELFRALNDAGSTAERVCERRRNFYKAQGLNNAAEDLHARCAEIQERIDQGEATYNQAVRDLYENDEAWRRASSVQTARMDELLEFQRINESAEHRVVGLVVETRPDAVTPENLTLIRALGCTKVQMGIQSLDPQVLKQNNRSLRLETIERAFGLLRLYGFKIHAHFMVNLLGANPARDREDYRTFVTNARYLPDEVKLYPCVLVESAGLMQHFTDGSWQPYDEETLVDILVDDTLATPTYMRISRMIRDISAHDIKAGNKKTNLRQMVEEQVARTQIPVKEIRYREISVAEIDPATLTLEEHQYETSVSTEHFLQWITPEGGIAGFLRLSLPHPDAFETLTSDALPINPDEAMIREVHVYGRVAKLQDGSLNDTSGVQHMGLGKQLIARATEIAAAQGYAKLNVISSVGTREYYRKQGFADNGLYQQKQL